MRRQAFPMIPIPFICRECISRLSQSSTRQLKPKSCQMHTQIIPISGPPPSRLLEEQEQKRKQEKQRLRASNTKSQKPQKSSSIVRSRAPWDGNVRKFVPKERDDIESLAGQPQAKTAFTFKRKILRSLGDYRFILNDLVYIYGLSHQEARHAVSQIERLLWGQKYHEQGVRIDIYHLWKRDFARLLQTIDNTPTPAEENPEETSINIWSSLERQDPATLKMAWERLDRDKRQRTWPQMILSALGSNPGILPAFIRISFDPSWCPNYVVEDMLYFLSRTADTLQDSHERRREVSELALSIINNCPPRYLNLGQILLPNIASSMSNSDLVEFYQHLKNIEHPLHPNTLLHFASQLAKSSEHKMHAAQIIDTLTNITGFDINSPAAASVCTSLLTLDEKPPYPEGNAAPDELFRILLERGFRPNLLGLSALMRNFSVRGHFDTAWKIFELIIEHGFEPDDHVYSILLNGAKLQRDPASVQRMVHIITVRNTWSVFLVNDTLDLIYREYDSHPERRRRQRKKVYNAWPPMLQHYTKFYDLAPLQKLTLFPLENLIISTSAPPKYSTAITQMIAALMPRPDVLLMQPESYTLILMMGAHMRSIMGPKALLRYYRYFLGLLKKDDPIAVKLVENHKTLIYDIFLRALMQFKNAVQFSLSLVRNMLRRATWEKKKLGKNTRHHPPSIYTWTILLNGFRNHNYVPGALNVLDIMVSRGNVEPNLVTWNALIRAFARTGNVGGAIKAMRCLEEAGFQSDDHTVDAFNTFPRHLRDRTVKLLEASRKNVSVSAPEAHFRWTTRGSQFDRDNNSLHTWQPAFRPSLPVDSPLAAGFENIVRAQKAWTQLSEAKGMPRRHVTATTKGP
ncbi:hypothetical protein F5X99DRAFT_388477 [Biscogniauxia marginata]|nr:hypothetical protein F5X99DRAFT_388477 [Biscogniauxia marginata]